MCRFREGGGQGVRTPLKNHENIVFFYNYWSGSPEKPSQHSMLGKHRPASEMPFNGALLAGRRWPTNTGLWIRPPPLNQLNPHQNTKKQTLSELDPLRQNFQDSRMQNIHVVRQTEAGKVMVLGRRETHK